MRRAEWRQRRAREAGHQKGASARKTAHVQGGTRAKRATRQAQFVPATTRSTALKGTTRGTTTTLITAVAKGSVSSLQQRPLTCRASHKVARGASAV